MTVSYWSHGPETIFIQFYVGKLDLKRRVSRCFLKDVTEELVLIQRLRIDVPECLKTKTNIIRIYEL